MNGMLEKSKITGVTCYVIVLFASYKRAFAFNITDINDSIKSGKKSVNIKKIDKWSIPYHEIRTVPSRKFLLDYDHSDDFFDR
jgi:penicillin-binding protein-related factor A (putative recombinase)